MIRAIIADVDGVIVGEKTGYNFPDPHTEVIRRLKAIEAQGISISLCTAKPYSSIEKIVDDADLRSLHITNGGGVITNPLENLTLKRHVIDQGVAQKIVQACLDHNTYVEFYTEDAYFIQRGQLSDITDIHTDILRFAPRVVESIIDEVSKHEIVKIMPIVTDDEAMAEVDQRLAPYKANATISWGAHPVALPRRFGIITAQGISKKQAAQEIAEHQNVGSHEILGIGDSTADWQFIELCGYAGAMGNASDKLKQLVSARGAQSFIGGTVDENGILDILDHFGLPGAR